MFCFCQDEKSVLNHKVSEKKIILSSNFDEAFTKYKEFIIDTTIKVGDIVSLDINNNSILISDYIGQKVFIIDFNGRLKKYLLQNHVILDSTGSLFQQSLLIIKSMLLMLPHGGIDLMKMVIVLEEWKHLFCHPNI
ncbi:hypothetical protein ABRY23_06020 [Melioribacteraceae bacterium 4301-Me]|uniref:hypothetical protein n=1 Tax=Pyranulibacter aquaticus TaxID=3163344 RepID=UPI0035980819